MQIRAEEGETPIEKNVAVIDEQGNVYEATWPKRAKGLVKNGRARFVDANTICLACPPDQNFGGNMDNNTSLTAREIFAQIQTLQKDITNNSINALYRLTEAISEMRDEVGNVGAEAVEAMSAVFTARERTLQDMLAFYIRLYDEAKAAEKE